MNIDYMASYDSTLKVLQKNITHMSQILDSNRNFSNEYRNNIDLCLMILPFLLKMLDECGYHYTYSLSFCGYYMWRNNDDKTINSKEIRCLTKRVNLGTISIDTITKQIYNELTSEIKNKETEVIALFLPVFYGSLSLMEVGYSWYSVYDIINLDKEQIKKEITKTNETKEVITPLYDFEGSTGIRSSLRRTE